MVRPASSDIGRSIKEGRNVKINAQSTKKVVSEMVSDFSTFGFLPMLGVSVVLVLLLMEWSLLM